jgi:hypothetical protein
MQELNTVSLSDFVKNANIIWNKGFDSVAPEMRSSGLVKVVPIPSNSGNTRDFSEADLNTYAKKKAEGDQVERAKIQQGYSKTMYQYRVGSEIGITYEMRTQNKYPEVVSALTALGTQPVERQELDLANRIGFGTATTYEDMDGQTVDISTGDTLALFYTAKTLKGSSTTYRTILANNPRLSKGSLESMERLFITDTYNHLGESKTIVPDILFTTDDPNTVNTAREYLQSTADPSGAHAGIKNVNAGKYRHVALSRLDMTAAGIKDSTKRYYWGLASSKFSTLMLGVWEETNLKTPSAGSNAEDFSTDDWNFGVRGGYGIVTLNGAWIRLSKGTSEA